MCFPELSDQTRSIEHLLTQGMPLPSFTLTPACALGSCKKKKKVQFLCRRLSLADDSTDSTLLALTSITPLYRLHKRNVEPSAPAPYSATLRSLISFRTHTFRLLQKQAAPDKKQFSGHETCGKILLGSSSTELSRSRKPARGVRHHWCK